MTMAATLTEAAHLSYKQLGIKKAAGTLRTAIGTFITATNPQFSDEVAAERPVGDWLIPLAALQIQINLNTPSLEDFDTAVDYVSRMCWAIFVATDLFLLPAAKGTAFLVSWNAAFGT